MISDDWIEVTIYAGVVFSLMICIIIGILVLTVIFE
jgi:hypothetical protein